MANILIADDDADARELLRFTLTSLGHNVTAVGNGQEALLSARSSPPEIIFSDILMPEMDGFDLCREIKADARLKTIPVVFYTATYVTPEDEQLAMDLGASGFIRKATDAARFVEIIKETLHRHELHDLPSAQVQRESLPGLAERHEHAVVQKLSKKMAELEIERQSHQQDLELMEAVFEAAKDAVIAMDSTGKIIIWNHGAAIPPKSNRGFE